MLALTDCAALRAGTIPKDALRMYSVRLSKEPIEDVLLAIEKLAETPKKDYESAMLDLGSLLKLVEICTIARHNRIERARNTVMVSWRCPDCKCTCTGWIQPDDFTERRCQGIPRSGLTITNRNGKPICGAVLQEILREASGNDPR